MLVENLRVLSCSWSCCNFFPQRWCCIVLPTTFCFFPRSVVQLLNILRNFFSPKMKLQYVMHNFYSSKWRAQQALTTILDSPRVKSLALSWSLGWIFVLPCLMVPSCFHFQLGLFLLYLLQTKGPTKVWFLGLSSRLLETCPLCPAISWQAVKLQQQTAKWHLWCTLLALTQLKISILSQLWNPLDAFIDRLSGL